jgi:hypoxanthine phosphoribosyltransferase
MLSVSWSEVTGMIELLTRALGRQTFDMVVGVSRSGLIPAVMLSHSLNVREFGVLDIRRTESDAINATKHAPAVMGDGLNLGAVSGRRVLLVDDILGEGATFRVARRFLDTRGAAVQSVALVVNRANCRDEPEQFVDLFACSVHDWVVFPWEGKQPAVRGD